MRAAVQRVLARGADPLSDEELESLRLQLRRHIQMLIPEVERAARRLPRGDIPRECALTGAGEARMRLRLGPGDTLTVRVAVVQKLARSVRNLCDHNEKLRGENA
ncbi:MULTISPECIES: DUF6415 family natural product biosynthesis protein [Streptomyces]|uniref:DUF6415 family natural product biosynthesis protein n=1 Tax=Streptomyces TaxID=1883 RepID=UPI0014886E88|nr:MULTISPECIES: DUF6415 family natural product biosynthesis protein [Streptomyces]